MGLNFGMHQFQRKSNFTKSGMAPGIFRRGADSSDEWAKIWFSGYYKCKKSPKNSTVNFQWRASMLRRGLLPSPGATPVLSDCLINPDAVFASKSVWIYKVGYTYTSSTYVFVELRNRSQKGFILLPRSIRMNLGMNDQ